MNWNDIRRRLTARKSPGDTASGKLIATYPLPAIASGLVSSLYNITDQIFVGRSIGKLGNATTNVAFPLVMMITTAAMVFGAGGAGAFSLYLGQREEQRSRGNHYDPPAVFRPVADRAGLPPPAVYAHLFRRAGPPWHTPLSTPASSPWARPLPPLSGSRWTER